jgi:ribosome-binding ATPase YchF (GTP1/OBG family)
VSLQVGIVGLANAGKTTLFNALTHAGAEITAYATVSEKPNLGVATIPDERLAKVAEVAGSGEVTPAAIRITDVPGIGPALLGNLRQSDALLAVVDGFSIGSSPERDLETLRLELLVADRDHVERRLEKVRKEAKSGEQAKRQEAARLEELLAHLEAERPLREWRGELPAELEPLTTKPLIEVVNGSAGIDLQLELELAELPAEEAAEYREGRASALDQIVDRLKGALDLITFFTASDKEARAWTLRRGQTALDAAETIHSDMARGFIRCEVIRWDDLVECGSHTEAARRGLQRLEGKAYLVEDGDVLHIRFNV